MGRSLVPYLVSKEEREEWSGEAKRQLRRMRDLGEGWEAHLRKLDMAELERLERAAAQIRVLWDLE